MQQSHLEFDRHRGPVTSVIDVPNSAMFASGAYDGAVALIDPVAESFQLLGYHDHLVNRVTCDVSGEYLASCSSDYSINIWNLAAPERSPTRLLGHADDVEDFAFVSSDVGVSVSRDRRILVWDIPSRAVTQEIRGHEQDVLSVEVIDDKIFTSSDDMTLRVWSLHTGELVSKLGPFEQETDSLAIDSVNRTVVLGCDDGWVRVFKIGSWELANEWRAHDAAIKRVAASPATGDILSAAYDGAVKLWGAEGDLLGALQRDCSYWERSFNWTKDGCRIVAGTFDGTAAVWHADSGEMVAEIGAEGGNACFNDVVPIDEDLIAACADDGVLRMGSLAHERWESQVCPPQMSLCNAITYDAERCALLLGRHDGVLDVFARTDEGLIHRSGVEIGEGPINCVAPSTGPRTGPVTALVACYSGAVALLGEDFAKIQTHHLHEGAIKAVALHPSLPLAASCDASGEVLQWSLTGEVLRRYPGHTAIVDDVDVSPSGSVLATVSRDFTLRVWEFETGMPIEVHRLGSRSPKCVTFVGEDLIVVGNYWGELMVFDRSTGQQRTFQVAENGISGIRPLDGNVILSSYDGSLYLADPVSALVIKQLSAMRQRQLQSVCIDGEVVA